MNNKNLLIILYKARDYQKDPDPEHWRTISGAKVHLDNNGEIDGGAGGKFTGNYWDGQKGAQHLIGPHTMIKRDINAGIPDISVFGRTLFGGKNPKAGTQKTETKKNTGTVKRNYNNGLAKGIGSKHYDAMTEKVESCDHQAFKTFWETTQDNVEVADIKHKGTAYTDPRGNRIHIDLERTAKGTAQKAPYQTAFHESAHAIDWKAGNGQTYFSVTYKNGIFAKTIIEEITEQINGLTEQAKKDIVAHGNDLDWLYENGYVNEWEKYTIETAIRNGIRSRLPLTFKKELVYQKIINDINKLPPIARIDISDIIDGVTKGKTKSGHGPTYWRKTRKSYGENAGIAMEAFAEMTSATVTNAASLAEIKKRLPKSYAIYEEMIEHITKEKLTLK